MNNKKVLTLSERKELYLSMMDEIDTFCRSNNIRYSLATGTLIGAIRHKGFIPWDDDLDIMMPLPDMLKFRKIFKSNNLRYLDIDIDENYQFPFSRIESLNTYSYKWPFFRSYGLCIDIYPIVGLPKRNIEIDNFFFAARKILKRRLFLNELQEVIKRLTSINKINITTEVNINYRDFMFQYPYGESGRFYHMGGSPNWGAVLDEDYFDDFVDVSFEGRMYKSVSRYNKLLTNGYGDYMQFPPESERHPYHGDYYYWKEN